MLIQNPNLTEVVSVLTWVFICLVFVVAIMILVMKFLFDYIRDVEVKLIAQTSPEHKALTYEYYRRVMQERQTQEEKKHLDKMFKDEKKGANL